MKQEEYFKLLLKTREKYLSGHSIKAELDELVNELHKDTKK